jgi:potassium/chloride transporter 4/5/6
LTVVDADDCGNPTNLHVQALAKQLQHVGGGIHMLTSIIYHDSACAWITETCELMQHSKTLLQRHMAVNGLDDCFAQVSATTNNPSQSLCSAVVHSGFGPLSPNTVPITFPTTGRTPKRMDDFVSSLQGIMNLHKAVILFQGSPDYYAVLPLPSRRELATSRDSSTIEVWWVVHDRGLLLLLPYILSKHERYARSRLRLFAVASSPAENPDRLREAVMDNLRQVRISVTVQVVNLSTRYVGSTKLDDCHTSDKRQYCRG